MFAHRKLGRAEFQRLGLSAGQPKVLACLREEDGLVQRELAQRCNVEPATMTTLLRGLLADGLVRKEPVHVSGGKRAFGVFLTEKGRDCARQVEAVMQMLEERALRGIPPAERRALADLLERVADNLS